MLTKKIMRICESMVHDERIDDDSKEIISEYVEEITDAVFENSSQGLCEDDDDDVDDDFIEDELSRMKKKYSNTKDVIDKLRDYLDDDDDDDDEYFFGD